MTIRGDFYGDTIGVPWLWDMELTAAVWVVRWDEKLRVGDEEMELVCGDNVQEVCQ